jgi:microcystin-dependent protein
MAQPYIGEIRMFAGTFAPRGWAYCNGQLVSINENDALFNLIGTTYGGDGVVTFALPDLRGRVPMHQGNGRTLSESGGAEAVALTDHQIPTHNHLLLTSTSLAQDESPVGHALARTAETDLYAHEADTPLDLVRTAGFGQPHTNLQPYLCIGFIISLFGIFPTQS